MLQEILVISQDTERSNHGTGLTTFYISNGTSYLSFLTNKSHRVRTICFPKGGDGCMTIHLLKLIKLFDNM